MELDKDFNLIIGLRIFETDMIIEMLHSMGPKARGYAVRILREYVEAVNNLTPPKQITHSNH